MRCQCDAAGEKVNAILSAESIERCFKAVVCSESRVQFWSLVFKKDELRRMFRGGLL